MPSIHTNRSFNVALSKGAFAARDRATWNELISMSKRELAEIAMRLGASCAGACDDSAAGLETIRQERAALKANGII